eukprot:2004353-Pyramimonas_sp.AAC.1
MSIKNVAEEVEYLQSGLNIHFMDLTSALEKKLSAAFTSWPSNDVERILDTFLVDAQSHALADHVIAEMLLSAVLMHNPKCLKQCSENDRKRNNYNGKRRRHSSMDVDPIAALERAAAHIEASLAKYVETCPAPYSLIARAAAEASYIYRALKVYTDIETAKNVLDADG